MKEGQGLEAQVFSGIRVTVQPCCECEREYLLSDQHEGFPLNTDLQYHNNPSLIFFFLLVKQLLLERRVV